MRTPTLYDATGSPIKKNSIRGEQASPSISGVRSYGNLVPAGSYSPAKIARILKDASAGDILAQAELFEDMEEKDTHIFAEMSKRKRAVASLDYQIHPFDDSKEAEKIAVFVRKNFEALADNQNNIDELKGVHDLVFGLADAIGKSLSMVEIIWDISEGQFFIKALKQRPINWFHFHPYNQTELRLFDGSYEGEELIPGKWAIHFHPAKSGSIYRAALYRILAWLFLFRNYDLKAWVQFLETFGIPLRIGKYPAYATESEQEKLLEAVTNIATDAAVIIPEGMAIDILNVVRTASGNPHKTLMDWTEKEISKAILGATLTSDIGGRGSYAAANVHNVVRMDILASDVSLIAQTINQHIIKPLVHLNFGPSAPLPYIQFNIPKPDERELNAKILADLIDRGFTDIPLWWIREVFNIPKPEKGDITLKDLLSGVNLNTNRELHINTPSKEEIAQQEIDKLVEKISTDKNFEEILKPIIEPIIKIINQSETFEQATEKLASAFPDMQSNELESLLQKAIFLSEVWGRING